MSDIIINVLSEHLFQKALCELEDGIVKNCEVINNIRYADDTVLVSWLTDLQRLAYRTITSSTSVHYGMKFKSKKRQIVITSKQQHINVQFYVCNEEEVKACICPTQERIVQYKTNSTAITLFHLENFAKVMIFGHFIYLERLYPIFHFATSYVCR